MDRSSGDTGPPQQAFDGVYRRCLRSAAAQEAQTRVIVFHTFSKRSSVGKSVAELVALSVHCEAQRNLLHHWDFTESGREELATEHCDRLLVFDETGRLVGDPKHAAATVQETAFTITAGVGRLRSAVWAKELRTCTWRTIGISSGEKPIAQIVGEANRQRVQGDQVRLLDVPACTDDAQYGVFDSLPEGETSAKRFANRIERACAHHFGYPAREFVTRTASISGITKRCRQWMRTFYREAQVADERWEGRFAERFALAYAAGRLAIEWDILPWRGRELLDAVVATYQVSRSVVPQETSTTDIVAKICAGLRDRSRIHDLRSTTQHTIGPNVNEADGFIKQDKQGVYYAIKRAAFERWVGKNVDLASLGKQLLQDGYLITEARRHDTPTKQVKIGAYRGSPGTIVLGRISSYLEEQANDIHSGTLSGLWFLRFRWFGSNTDQDYSRLLDQDCSLTATREKIGLS